MALIDSLISYWKMDEASGNALDAHGSNDLTDNNTVGGGTGIISNGRDFERDNSEYFSKADNADLSFGDDPMSISLWANLESTPDMYFVAKYNSGSFEDEYSISLNGFTDRVDFVVQNSGFASVRANNFGALSTGTWYHIVVWHDPTGNEIGITINDGTPDTASYSGGMLDGSGDFNIGRHASFGLYFDGIIDEVGIWDKVLSSSEITELYNSGAGLAYPFSAGGGGTKSKLLLLGVS